MCKKKGELFSGWFSSGFPIGLSNEKLQPILFVVGVGRRGFHVVEARRRKPSSKTVIYLPNFFIPNKHCSFELCSARRSSSHDARPAIS
jgi:hypothetical protein